MSKKFTFMIMSDTKGVTRRFVISDAWVKALIAIGFVGFILLASVVVDYFGLLFQDLETKHLKVENRRLHNQVDLIEGKLENLEAALDRVHSFTTKLRLITDTKDENRSLKLAIGPIARDPESLEAADDISRDPAAIMPHQEESVFFAKPLLESAEGELARTDDRGYHSLSIRFDRAIKHAALREQGVLELWESLSVRQSLLRATPSIKPTRGWYTSPFGYRSSPMTGAMALHTGLDIAAALGTPVYAVADGVVSFAGYDGGYGKLVSVDHGYGVVTRYGHNSELYVQVGQKIKRGDVLSAVGNTGRSTAAHLHYEVRVGGIPVDPVNYILEQ